MSQKIDHLLPEWREAFERWKAAHPEDADGATPMTYLAGACHALEEFGYEINTYDKVREEVTEGR